MPSSSDFYNRLVDANTKLDGVNGRLDTVNGKLDTILNAVNAVNNSVNIVNKTLLWGFGQLITIGNYTNQALHENNKQNDTIICILEHISVNTCAILNEANAQTGLQKTIKDNTSLLADLYAATHGEAAMAREKLEEMRKQVEKCCPPRTPPPPCQYTPCPKEYRPIPPPPVVNPNPDRPPIG